VVAAYRSSHEFGRVAASGRVVIVGSLLWAVALDGFPPRPPRHLGSLICLAGGVIMYAR
jgi:small multidrug resistance family-3 protein